MRHPEAIFVQLTTGCNAKCISCPHPFTYGKSGGHKSGNMSEDTWARLLRQIIDAGYQGQVGLYLHHEPLMVKALEQRIRDVNRHTNAFVVLSTNGALLDKDRRRRLIDAGPRTVHINISSADPAQYEAIMKLPFEPTRQNTLAFIREARGFVNVEINVPLLPGVDAGLFREVFPGVKINSEFWANSRGGLLENVSAQEHGSRFKLGGFCKQPTQNFNVLYDGSVILCCQDWAHETKQDFPNIRDQNLFDTYRSALMQKIRREFRNGNYTRYRACDKCADEMGFDRA